MPNDQPISPEEFAAKIKAKYPDYASVPDQELTQKILFKYPEYAPKVRVASPTAAGKPEFGYRIPGQEQIVSGVKKAGDVFESTLNKLGGKRLGEYERTHPNFGTNVGIATGVETGMSALPGVLEEVGVGLKNVSGAAKTEMERMAGVPKAIRSEQEISRNVQAGNVSKFREAEQTAKEAQEAAKGKNISTYREAEQYLATKQEEVAAANKADREAYQQAKKTAVDEQAKQDIIAARKANLAKTTEQIKPALQKNLHDVQDAVFGDLDQRWDKVRTAVGTTIKANPQSIASSMNTSMNSVTSVNQGLFTKVVENAFGGASPAQLTWPEAQAAYTNIGNRLAQGGLPGDVWRGLKAFQDGLGTEMESMANAAGVKSDFVGVKKDWGQAMADLKDTYKPIAKGGSPVAHALSKADPQGAAKVFEGPLTGPANRAMKILSRYKKYGADLSYPLRYRSMLEEGESLPKPKGVKMPTEPTPRPTPEMTSSPYKPGPPSPNVAEYKTHPVDKEAIRKEAMSKFKKKTAVYAGSGLGLTAGAYELWQRLTGNSGTSAPHP